MSGGGEAKQLHEYAIVLLLFCLIVAFCINRFISRKGITWLPEAGITMLTALFFGLLVRAANQEEEEVIRSTISFSDNFFFSVLLPPIIFESGFNMRRRKFFTNFVSICLLAIVGTLLSSFLTGYLVYGVGKISGVFAMSPLEALIFGTLISATDPVTVLSIFSKLGVTDNLYAMVFGESVLNDAVAIVLFQALGNFLGDSVDGPGVGRAIGDFFKIFFGSIAIGWGSGVITSILTKYGKWPPDAYYVEVCLITAVAYASYMLAEATKLSGIVAILFNGITSAHYSSHNITREANDLAHGFFHSLAFFFESLVFVFLGVSMANLNFDDEGLFPLLILTIPIVLLSRACNIYPLCTLANTRRKKDRQIPVSFMHIMFMSGLRGAIAFALAARTNDPEGGYSLHVGHVIFTITSIIVLLTVMIPGGMMPWLLNKLSVPCGEDANAMAADKSNTGLPTTDAGARRQTVSVGAALDFDRKYFKVWFTNRDRDDFAHCSRNELELRSVADRLSQDMSEAVEPTAKDTATSDQM